MTVAIVAGNPLIRAQDLLRGRMTPMMGGWRLDGRPASVRQIIEAANDVADSRGLPRIAYPGVAGAGQRGLR